jgi:pimeloyl-ACP methyl ester carboxylesterase
MLSLSTPSNPVHVFAIDYRGFGVSTGSPTEEGLVTDGVSLINFLTAGPLKVPTSRIVIMGQSLGTAVTAAVAERYTFGSPDSTAVQPAIKDAEPFAGVILVASFSNVANVIESYSIKGLTPPMLSPLIGYPRFQRWVLSHIVDRWDTAARLARLTGVNITNPDASVSAHKDLDLTIIHSSNDVEIPWYEGRRNWAAATGETLKGAPGALTYERTEIGKPVSEVKIWENTITRKDGTTALKKVRWERVRYGGMLNHPDPEALDFRFDANDTKFEGHDRVATFSVAGLAALRAFE